MLSNQTEQSSSCLYKTVRKRNKPTNSTIDSLVSDWQTPTQELRSCVEICTTSLAQSRALRLWDRRTNTVISNMGLQL